MPPIESAVTDPFRARPKIRTAVVARNLWLITWIKVMLRARGVEGTMKWIHSTTRQRPRDQASWADIRAIEYHVAMAGALYPGRALCLEQSLTLYFLLRKAAVDARFVMGVQPYPFAAHAWVEYRGIPLTDVPEHINHFALFQGPTT